MGMLAQLNQRSAQGGFSLGGKHKRNRGFTLIELMMVVAILGIVASIAMPAYTEYVKKGRRSAAQSHLMEIAQRQQQYLLDARAYASTLTTLGVTTPTEVSNYYTIKVDVTDAPPTFTITATAQGSQASDGNLTLDNTGAKTPAAKW